ncbi:MAG: hypothetical protein R3D28_26365, partial [Geminicoccaceae bacterium]
MLTNRLYRAARRIFGFRPPSPRPRLRAGDLLPAQPCLDPVAIPHCLVAVSTRRVSRRREVVPEVRFHPIRRHAETIFVHDAEVVLRTGATLLSGSSV